MTRTDNGRSWQPRPYPERHRPDGRRAVEQSFAVGAKTVAGVSLGLLGILVGAAVAGALLETVIIPSLVVKVAGSLAGGGIGLAKGLGDERRHRRREADRDPLE